MSSQTLIAGDRIASLRQERGWSQERLAEQSRVSTRTVQRAEASEPIRLENLRSLATALGVAATELRDAVPLARLNEIANDFTCSHCGARLSQLTFVEHEYGDAEWEFFECGAERGWRNRPCPKDPRFPRFEDYKLLVREDEPGVFWCHASGTTDAARAVELQNGMGRTAGEAALWVRRSYVAAREGADAAEAFLPLLGAR